MKIRTIKTTKVKAKDDLYKLFDRSILELQEKSIIVITSKVVSLCQGRVASLGLKDEQIQKEADYYLEGVKPYGMILTIKENVILPNAGIDESNANGSCVLLPVQIQKTVNEIRTYFREKFELKELGVIISDSKTTPLRWGTTGVGLAYSGFYPLNDYIGKGDIFDKTMLATKANVLDGLAAAAVLAMGEGSEQTPIAIIEDLDFVRFNENNPTKQELEELKISPEDDLYSPILNIKTWKKFKA